MFKAVVLCVVFLVAFLTILNRFVSNNNNVQPSFRITLNQYNNEDLDCATKRFAVNKSDIKHDKNLALYSCNKNQLITENIKYHLNTPLTRRHSLPINCKKLFEGDKLELQKAVRVQNDDLGSRRIPSSLHQCKTYVAQFGYITDSLSEDEHNFPIAYSIVMYTDEQQFEKLLRAIYRPQNHYCVHVDLSANSTVFEFVKHVTKCFTNVHLAERRIDVQWAQFSVLETELICMKQLLRQKNWKYFINLTGQEFPLRTNLELVKILKAYRGANDIEGLVKGNLCVS